MAGIPTGDLASDPSGHHKVALWASSLRQWLRAHPALLFVVVGLVIPNAVCLGAIAAGIGTPVRAAAIIGYFAVVLSVRLFPLPVAVALFFGVLAYDIASTIGLLFNLGFFDLVIILRFARQVDFFSSPLYLALGALIAATSGLALWLLIAERQTLRQARLGPPLAILLLVSGIDAAANTSPHYDFGSAMAAGHPFESAAKASGFEAMALGPDKRNLLLVIVEGLGVLEASRNQARVVAPLMENPALRRRFTVSSGETTYYGSTTAAELRELCATRQSFQELLDDRTPTFAADCLPAVLNRHGYQTHAVHSFGARMFDRYQWWPKIGFRDRKFFSNLDQRLPRCGAVWVGMCDTAVVGTLKKTLEDRSHPQFVYFLTLNTHIPIRPGEHSHTYPCKDDGGVFGRKTVCDMANMWRDVFASVARLAADKDLAPTDVLIVGDHAPPLWSRRDRGMFKPGKVPWIRLAWKGGDGTATR